MGLRPWPFAPVPPVSALAIDVAGGGVLSVVPGVVGGQQAPADPHSSRTAWSSSSRVVRRPGAAPPSVAALGGHLRIVHVAWPQLRRGRGLQRLTSLAADILLHLLNGT